MVDVDSILHPYQKSAKDFLVQNRYAALFFPMGLGKSLITLSALQEINEPGHILIIAPKTIARSTWASEILDWGFSVNTQSLLVNKRGKDLSKKKRYEIYESIKTNRKSTIYFINREKIVDLVEYFNSGTERQPDYSTWPFHTIVIDEMQGFKSHKSSRFKAIKCIRQYTYRLIGLTGTPTPNGLMDLWSQIWMLDCGQRLGKNITAYRDAWFYESKHMNGYPVDWTPKPGAEDDIYERIKDIVISAKSDVISLPPLTINDVFGYMRPDEWDVYKTLKITQVFKPDETKEDVVTAVNAGVLSMKLQQLASGTLYIDIDDNTPANRKNRKFEIIHDIKLEQLEYIINNANDNVLIAYHFANDAGRIIDYLQSKGIDAKLFNKTPEMISDWNNGNIQAMLIQPASAGHGLNLQKGGHTLVWYTMPWSLEEYEQTNARLYRQGQTHPTIIHRLIMKKTIDERIAKSLQEKHCTQNDLLDAVTCEFDDLYSDLYDDLYDELADKL